MAGRGGELVADEGEMPAIGEVLQDFLLSEGMEELGDLISIRKVWNETVGEKVAREAIPYRLEGERLFVGVRSHAWAQELHYRKEEIKKALMEVTGVEIEEIVIRKINLK